MTHTLSEDRLERAAAAFGTDGFAVVENLASPATVAHVGGIYDRIMNGSLTFPGTDRMLGGLTPQVMMAHLHHPELLDNDAFANAQEIARRVMGVDNPALSMSMLIYKPPRHPHPTPWHCDYSYAFTPVTRAGAYIDNASVLQFWLALEDVSEDMGCMEFIPGAQHDPMPAHHVHSGAPNDPARLLAMTDPGRQLDLSKARKCPLRAGSATLHGYMTPHYTGPNESRLRGRRAFIFTFLHPDRFMQTRGGSRTETA